VPIPINSTTGQPVDRFHDRIDHLLVQLEEDRTKIIIPTPALSEILVRAGTAGPEYLARINSEAVFRIVPFDEGAAVEVAGMTRSAVDSGVKRGGVEGNWTRSNTTGK
jgi:predicted nucleic acid-binding protein